MLKYTSFIFFLLLLMSCSDDTFVETGFAEKLNKEVLDPFIFTDAVKTKKTIPKPVEFLVAKDDSRLQNKQKNTLIVLHTTIEYKNAVVGGIGSVTATIVPKQNDFISKEGMKIQADVLMPRYSFYDPVIALGNPPEPFAKIEHIFNFRPVTSTIYSVKSKDGSYTYLLEPDISLKGLFDISSSKEIYSHKVKDSTHLIRMAYFSSASSAFSNMFQTPSRKRYFDVVHNHSVPNSIAIGLTKVLYSPYLASVGQKSPAQVFTMHNLDWDQGIYRHTFLGNAINLMHLGITYADAVLGVSETMIEEGLMKDNKFSFGLARPLNAVRQKGRLYGIFNGLDAEAYNPFNNNTLVFPPSAGHQGFDLRYDHNDIVASKQGIKVELAKMGLIKDATRPLYMYVGRYAMEKGLALLPRAAEKIVELGGSFIVMGQDVGSAPANEIIKELIAMGPGLGGHLYTMKGNYDQEQKKFKTGNLVRAASDFVLVPSLFEAAGLVPVECMLLGTIPIGTNITGLQDSLRPIRWSSTSDLKTLEGNAFIFDAGRHLSSYDAKKITDAQRTFMEQGMMQALEEAHEFLAFSKARRSEMNAFLKRIMNEVKSFDWAHPNGALEKYNKMYQDLISNH